jgi:hypothetical protein
MARLVQLQQEVIGTLYRKRTMHNARRKAFVRHGVPAQFRSVDARRGKAGDNTRERSQSVQAQGRPMAFWPSIIGNPVAPSLSAEALSPADSRDSSGSGTITNRNGNIVLEPFQGKRHSLLTRMHSGNWHGAPNPGTCQ